MQNYPKYCMEIQIFNNIYYCMYTFIRFLAANIAKKFRLPEIQKDVIGESSQ